MTGLAPFLVAHAAVACATWLFLRPECPSVKKLLHGKWVHVPCMVCGTTNRLEVPQTTSAHPSGCAQTVHASGSVC